MHFGLGADRGVSRVEIRWPSGVQQVLTNVDGDKQVVIDEPKESNSAEKVALPGAVKP